MQLRWGALLFLAYYVMFASVATVQTYKGGFANGTIHFKPQCSTLVNNLLARYSERPLTFRSYTIISQQVDTCNERS